MKINKNMLKSKRVLKGLSQPDMAKNLTCSVPAYNQKENGKRAFSAIEIAKISKVLDLSAEEIKDIFFTDELNANSNL